MKRLDKKSKQKKRSMFMLLSKGSGDLLDTWSCSSRNSEVVQVTYNLTQILQNNRMVWWDAIVPEWRGTVYLSRKSDTIVSPELTVKKEH